MTPRIKISLDECGCQKPGCRTKFGTPNRHHLRHEKRWINLWTHQGPPGFVGDPGKGRRLLTLLKERYYQFRPQDTVRICERHHAEIHDIYRLVYARCEARFRVPWEAFTWKEAVFAMRECKKACREWLTHSSPGMSPKEAGWR